MATIKSYTDINQSKKLAEILPLESADMCYIKRELNDTFIETPIIKPIGSVWKSLSCWSLAALISIIPQEIFNGEYILNITEGCDNRWVLTYDGYEDRTKSYYGLSSGADTIIDACCGLILKLNELKML